MSTDLHSKHSFTHFSKTIAPWGNERKLSTIIIFEPCKFNVNFCDIFKKYQNPLINFKFVSGVKEYSFYTSEKMVSK